MFFPSVYVVIAKIIKFQTWNRNDIDEFWIKLLSHTFVYCNLLCEKITPYPFKVLHEIEPKLESKLIKSEIIQTH